MHHPNAWEAQSCHDYWDALISAVSLLQTQYYYNYVVLGSLALTSSHFDVGANSFLLDDVACNGSEATLLLCNHLPLHQHDCTTSEQAGVRCQTGEISPLSLRIHLDHYIHTFS